MGRKINLNEPKVHRIPKKTLRNFKIDKHFQPPTKKLAKSPHQLFNEKSSLSECHQISSAHKSIKFDVVDCTQASNDGCDEFMWRTACKFSISRSAVSSPSPAPKHLSFECFLHEEPSQTPLIIFLSVFLALLNIFYRARDYASFHLLSCSKRDTRPPQRVSTPVRRCQIISSHTVHWSAAKTSLHKLKSVHSLIAVLSSSLTSAFWSAAAAVSEFFHFL